MKIPFEEEILEMVNASFEPSSLPVLPDSDLKSSDSLDINEEVVVIWDSKGGRKWYVGLI